MRYAFVCFFPAAPPESGAGWVSYDLARFVPGDNSLLQLGPADGDWSVCEGLRVIQMGQAGDGRWGKLLGIPRFVGWIMGRLKDLQPDVVVLEGASWVLYHWWLLRAVREGLPGVRVVYHAHNVEFALRMEKHGRLVRGLTRWAEGNVLRGADRSFAVSDVDRGIFEDLYCVRPLLLPNGVDISQFSEVSEDTVQTCRERYGLDSHTLLFMGSYAYKPNREAIDFLVTRVMPRVLEQRPDVRLAIIGGEVPYRRDWLCCPGVIPDEWVAPFVLSCAVSVAPIFSGSGTRLKILTSLSAGIPVIATPKGAEGLDLVASEEICIAESVQDFTESIVQLLSAPDSGSGLGMMGKRAVAERYDWSLIATAFHREMAALFFASGKQKNGT